MDSRHREILRKSRPILVSCIVDVESLCDHLMMENILTEGMREEVMAKSTRSSQVREILDIIPRRGKNAYDHFHQALVDTKNQRAADILKPELAIPNPEMMPSKKIQYSKKLDDEINDKKPTENSFSEGKSNAPFPTNVSETSFSNTCTPFSTEESFGNTASGTAESTATSNASSCTVESSSNTASGTAESTATSNASSCTVESSSNTASGTAESTATSNASSCTVESSSNTASGTAESTATSNASSCMEESSSNTASCTAESTNNTASSQDVLEEWPSIQDHACLKINLNKAESPHFRADLESNSSYNTGQYKYHGKAIIIINKDFAVEGQQLPNRKNSDLDATRLSMLFKALGFQVSSHNNKSNKELAIILEKERSRDYSNYGCMVMVIVSHGVGKKVYCADGQEMDLDSFLEVFDEDHCPALKGKPKIFIVQACKGNETPDSLQNEVMESLVLNEPADSMVLSEPAESLLLRADMFLARATIDKEVAFQQQVFGSKFIQAFVFIVQKSTCKNDLNTIFSQVNSVARQEGDNIAQCSSSLQKKFYFCAKT